MNGESVFKITTSRKTLLTVLLFNCLFVQLKTEHGDCSSRDINGMCSSAKVDKDENEEHSFSGAHGSHRYSKGITYTLHTIQTKRTNGILRKTFLSKMKI